MPSHFAVSVTSVVFALLAAFGLTTTLLASSAAVAQPYMLLQGAWRGTGTISPQGNALERVVCRLNYDLAGNRLSQSLDCAGADFRIKAIGSFTVRGNSVSGSWHETQFNIGGSASGSARGDRIFVRISGDRFQGRMTMQVPSRSSHRVDITEFDPGTGRYTQMATINFRR